MTITILIYTLFLFLLNQNQKYVLLHILFSHDLFHIVIAYINHHILLIEMFLLMNFV